MNNNTKQDNYTDFRRILAKSGLHYSEVKVKDTLKDTGKITFNVRQNQKEVLNSKLSKIREKINTLGMELKESEKQTTTTKPQDIAPVSVRWDTKPVCYNKKSLNTNYNAKTKGQFNKESSSSFLYRSFSKTCPGMNNKTKSVKT